MRAIPEMIIVVASFVGFFIAATIFHKKRTQQLHMLHCPMNGKCDEVLTSRYSRFLGVPVEILGMLYYSAIFFSYFMATILAINLATWHTILLTALSSAGFLFSIYLTMIQMAALRRWCTWCLWSALMTVIIFFVAVMYV